MAGFLTFINNQPYELQPLPEVGKEYHFFDDGKIKPSRHSIITIVEIIPFEGCNDAELLDNWRCDVFDCPWLYADKTDYFIKAVWSDDEAYFVRTTDGGWFSLGFFGGRLDIDGSLYKNMLNSN